MDRSDSFGGQRDPFITIKTFVSILNAENSLDAIIMRQGHDDFFNHVIESWTKTPTGDYSGSNLFGLKINMFSRSCFQPTFHRFDILFGTVMTRRKDIRTLIDETFVWEITFTSQGCLRIIERRSYFGKTEGFLLFGEMFHFHDITGRRVKKFEFF